MAKVGPAQGAPEPLGLEAVLTSEQLKRVFLTFLQEEQGEDGLLFWDAAERFRGLADTKYDTKVSKNPCVASLEPAVDQACDAATLKQLLLDRFVARGADKEVNIEDWTRRTIIQKAASQDVPDAAAPAAPDLFVPAQREVQDGLSADAFPRFLQDAKLHNISKSEASRRLTVSHLVGFVFFLTLGLLAGTRTFPDRKCRLLLVPSFFLWTSIVVTARMRV